MIKLGDEVKDPITGFKGIAIGKSEWLYGCSTIGVKPKMSSDGKVQDAQWFDELQLKEVEPKKAKRTGGPRPIPEQSTMLRR